MIDKLRLSGLAGWGAGMWKRPAVRRLLQFVWLGLVAIFIGAAVVASWDQLSALTWTPALVGFFGLAFLAALTRRLAGGLLWAALIWVICKGRHIPLLRSLRYYFISNLATYLPGSYWNVPSLIILYKREGVMAMETGAALILLHFLVLVSGGLWALIGLKLLPDATNIPSFSYIVYTAAVFLGLLLVHPACFNLISRLMTGLLKQRSVEIKVGYGVMLALLAGAVFVWLLGGISLLFQVHALAPVIPLTFEQVGIIGAIFAVSWLAGFVTPFAPNGIGVREGVMGLAFGLLGVSFELGIVIAAISRVIIVMEDIFWGGITLARREHGSTA